jgi:hypothetical protein
MFQMLGLVVGVIAPIRARPLTPPSASRFSAVLEYLSRQRRARPAELRAVWVFREIAANFTSALADYFRSFASNRAQ